MARHCTIYKSTRENELYLFVEKGSELSQLPEELLQRLGTVEVVMDLLLERGRKLARVKTEDVLAAIAEKGYFLQLPPTMHGHLYHGD